LEFLLILVFFLFGLSKQLAKINIL